MKSTQQEFDAYNASYQQLLDDPIRNVFAGGFRFFHQRKWWLIQEYLRSKVRDTEKLSWLDVGCGQGDLLKEGAAWFGDAQGCDMSEGMLKDCAGLNVWLQTEGTRLPVADNSFDFVTSVCVYHHVPIAERLALTAEIVRILRPGGALCIIEHNPFNPATQIIVKRTPVDKNAILLPSGMVKSLMLAAGLQQPEVHNFLFVPAGLYPSLGWVEAGLKWLPLGGQYAAFGQKL